MPVTVMSQELLHTFLLVYPPLITAVSSQNFMYVLISCSI